MLHFTTPYALSLLALIPAMAWFKARHRRQPVLRLSALPPASAAPASPALRIRTILPALKYTALALMIAALARPQWGTRHTTVLTEGINIVIAVDLSESMAALDFKIDGNVVNRLSAVKGVVKDFIAGRVGDRIGLVVFGSEAYTQLPLTRDYNAINTVLEQLEIGAAGKRTAIGDAIGISLKRITDVAAKSNIVILLTDGRSNTGVLSPVEAVTIAAERGVRVYTIGVGTRGKAPFLIQHPLLGQRTVYQEVDLDEDTLKMVAEKSGGKYFRADSTETLSAISSTIDALEKTTAKMKIYFDYRDFYSWLLLPAAGCLALYILLANTRFLRIP